MTRQAVRIVVVGSAVAGLTWAIQASGHDHDQPLVITRLIPVESHDVDHHVVEDTFRAEVRHTALPGSRDFAGVAARIVHPFGLPFPGNVQVIDGDLEFGSVRVGSDIESRDTITIRRHRHHPVKLHHLRWAISGRPDLVLPEAWAGDWRLTITSKDPDTGSISSIDEITDSLGAGEPVGLSLLPDFVGCTWTATDDVLEAACGARFRFDGCLGDGSADVTVARNGNFLTGRGQWQVIATGNCGEHAGNGGESIEIAGVRLSGDVEPEPFSPGILTRLAATPALSGLLVGRLDGNVLSPPVSDADCLRGRWRRLNNPRFRNVRECRVFVARQYGQHHDEGRR